MAPRRSTRLHPNFHASEEAVGTARRRSPRLHPQIHASEEGAGVTRRRSPRLRPQIRAGEEGTGVTRRGTSPAEPASLPDSDDMLREILIRLPPQPSSLPRASAVCRRWRALITDPKFYRQFYAHHRKPPLLGFFHLTDQGTMLTSVLDPPDRIPPQRFDFGRIHLLDFRHGLLLAKGIKPKEVLVCDLITCVQRRVSIPLELKRGRIKGVVLCTDAAADHVHGSCHSSPFKVVLVSIHRHHHRFHTCVYSSATGLWGDIISKETWRTISFKHMVLVGNCVYWFSLIDGIHEFDLDKNSLAVIAVPPDAYNVHHENWQITEAGDGVLGFAILSYPRFQVWQRNVNAHGLATWVLWKTIEMHNISQLPPQIERKTARLVRYEYDEDTDVILIHARRNIYRVHLKLMQWRKLYETPYVSSCLPFKSFYTPGTTIAREFTEAEVLNDA